MGAELDALYICMVDAKTAGFYEGIEDLIESSPWTSSLVLSRTRLLRMQKPC